MKTVEKQSISDICMNLAKIFLAISTVLLLAFLFAGGAVYPDERDVTGKCQIFESKWYHVQENGDLVAIEVPAKIDAEYGDEITLVTTLPADIKCGESICFRPVWQDVTIYVDGELRVNYTTKDTRPFGTNSAFRYVFLDLTEEDEGKELTYVFSSDSKYSGTFRTSYIGDKSSIWTYLINESGIRTIIALFLFLLSTFCIIVCMILKWGYKINLALNYLAWTLFFCSLWMLSEIEFRQLFFKNVSVLTGSTYWSLMIIPLPLFVYINEIQKHRYQKLFMVPIIYSCSVLVIGTFLQLFEVVQFVEQLPVIHAGDAIAVICVIATLTLDAISGRMKDYLVVGVGIYGMILTAVMEILLYYADTGISLGTVLAVGLLFLLIMAIIKTGQDLFVSEKKRQQAIAARESQAKFLANMSHEIRTPINAIIGMNEMILRESNNEEVLEYSRNIDSASNMLLELVNEILDFSKIESGLLELVEETYQFVPLIQEQILMLNARVGDKPISTQVEVAPDLPSAFYGDELRVKQIMTNLLSNAVKYTKEGIIKLKVSFGWIDDENVELIISVMDTGVGIREEDQSQLFESFKRFELSKNRNVEGSGLGLNIVKQLVDLMKGKITVNSEYGKGSEFTVSIPQKVMDKQAIGSLKSAMSHTDKPAPAKEDIFTAPDARVLVVDDNAMNLTLMKNLLKRTRMSVDLASSGKQCLEFTQQNIYDLILMDHMMPELDGVETLKLLRADDLNANQHAKVIALTANAIVGSREMYLEYGFDDYLSKPIKADGLDKILMMHLGKEEKKKMSDEHERGDVSEDIFYIDKTTGLSYCMDDEDFYADIVNVFCIQAPNFINQLEEFVKTRDWKQYAIVAHGIKSNTLTIGAVNFSKLSFEHEQAGKSENEEFILAEYPKYKDALKKLVEQLQG